MQAIYNSMKKKNNTDQFLIEKKSPLVLPPDFDELPEPASEAKSSEEDEFDIINSQLPKTLILFSFSSSPTVLHFRAGLGCWGRLFQSLKHVDNKLLDQLSELLRLPLGPSSHGHMDVVLVNLVASP